MADASTSDCLFCKIVAGDIPADVVHESDTTVAFRDIEPQAPTHVLVIPRSHHADAAALAAAEPTGWSTSSTPPPRSPRPKGSPTTATGWCSTPARPRTRPSSTHTCTCSAGAR